MMYATKLLAWLDTKPETFDMRNINTCVLGYLRTLDPSIMESTQEAEAETLHLDWEEYWDLFYSWTKGQHANAERAANVVRNFLWSGVVAWPDSL